MLRGRTPARGTIGGAREAPGPTHARARAHQDEADLAAGGAAPLYPGFIPGGSAHAGEQLMRLPWVLRVGLRDASSRPGSPMPAPSAQLLAPSARALLFDPPAERDGPASLRPGTGGPRARTAAPALTQPARLRRAARPGTRPRPPPAPGRGAARRGRRGRRRPARHRARRLRAVRPAGQHAPEHAGEIAALLDLRGMRQADYRTSIRAAAACAAGTDRGEPIAAR